MGTSQEVSVTELFRKRKTGEAKFSPKNLYDRDADCVTYFDQDVSTNSDQLDPFITLFYEPASSRLVGFKIKCVRMIVKRLLNAGKKRGKITFGDVLNVAEELSKEHEKKAMHRQQAKESDLAAIVLPDVK